MVVQWLRMQGNSHQFNPRPRKIPHTVEQWNLYTTATETVLQIPRDSTTEPMCHKEPTCPRAHALQEEKRNHEKPLHCNWRVDSTRHN